MESIQNSDTLSLPASRPWRRPFLMKKETSMSSHYTMTMAFSVVHRMSTYFTSYFLAKVGSGGNTPRTKQNYFRKIFMRQPSADYANLGIPQNLSRNSLAYIPCNRSPYSPARKKTIRTHLYRWTKKRSFSFGCQTEETLLHFTKKEKKTSESNYPINQMKSKA